MSITVSEYIINTLNQLGVKQFFGIPGDAINHLTEAIRVNNKCQFIAVRHEEVGAFAASAQAKLSHQPSVCMGTAGPGAIHLLNGLYDANRDGAPVIAITGQVSTDLIGNSSHQEVDLVRLFDDVASYNQLLTNPKQVQHVLYEAWRTALTERSVVHINLPENVASMKINAPKIENEIIPSDYNITPTETMIEKAAVLLAEAEKPVILLGDGARTAIENVIQFADKMNAPIIKTLKAKDLISDSFPLCIGGVGSLGSAPGTEAMEECDLIILIGTDFPYSEWYPSDKKVIQIDLSPSHISRRVPVDVPLVGNANETLILLNRFLVRRKMHCKTKQFLEHCQKKMRIDRESKTKQESSTNEPIEPSTLTAKISTIADSEAIICTDTGAVTAWVARHFDMKGNQRLLLSSNLASMGFSLPATIGAKLLYPNRQVLGIAGDGGFSMLMTDLLTAVKYKLNVTIIIFNNQKLGLIQMEQEAKGHPETETHLQDIDYAEYAKICGAYGVNVTQYEQLDSALNEAIQYPGVSVVNVYINREVLVIPPKVQIRQGINYAKAKVAELIGG